MDGDRERSRERVVSRRRTVLEIAKPRNVDDSLLIRGDAPYPFITVEKVTIF